MSAESSKKRLRLEFTKPAETQVEEVYRWFLSLPFDPNSNFDNAERWLTGMQRLLENEAETQGSDLPMRRRPSRDSTAKRERYLLLYRTSGRRSSPWHVVYELRDTG